MGAGEAWVNALRGVLPRNADERREVVKQRLKMAFDHADKDKNGVVCRMHALCAACMSYAACRMYVAWMHVACMTKLHVCRLKSTCCKYVAARCC